MGDTVRGLYLLGFSDEAIIDILNNQGSNFHVLERAYKESRDNIGIESIDMDRAEEIEILIRGMGSSIDIKIYTNLYLRAIGTTVFIQPEDRKEIEESLGISKQMFSNSLARLKEKGYISGTHGIYDLHEIKK